jgi:hyaluronate lyase
MYATVGQHLNGLESTMEAFKSWFFLDDAVVCLGAAITSHDGVPVETIVDNRRTDALLTVDDQAGWAHLEGHGGYVLPACPRLHTLREERTGSPDPVTRGYVTLWLDHGVDPGSAGYVYLLLPGAGLAQTRARAADPGWVCVLANSARQQGVQVPSLGVTAVNFWNDGAVGGLAASAPCAVLVRESSDGTATLTVSDPRQDLSGLAVTWDRPVAEVLHGHPLLANAATGAKLSLVFGCLSDQGGSSKTVTVRLG